MSILYNFGIYFYRWIIGLVSLFNPKAKLWIDGRRNWRTNLVNATKGADNIIWFHAASLGEFEQGRPLIERLKRENKNVFILLTFFSPSGYEIQKNFKDADYICYLPSDTKANAKAFISIVKPKKIFFIKYEFWFNYMSQINQNEIPFYLISGIFRKEQIFFKWYGQWFRKKLEAFKTFYVQDSASVERLHAIGFDNTVLTGDTRFDRVISIAENSKDLEIISKFAAGKSCLVMGSTWPKEEDMLSEYINNNPGYKYIIAPHEIGEAHLIEIESKLKLKVQRFSKINSSDIENVNVVLIDNIGMLSSIYKYANLAFVGGAFGKGLHNILEPAVYGIPVVFGPNYSKFQEASDLIREKSAFSVSDKTELLACLDNFFIDIESAKKAGGNAKSFIYKSKGATDILWQDVFK